MRVTILALTLSLVACNGDDPKDKGPATTDTDTDTDDPTGPPPALCVPQLVAVAQNYVEGDIVEVQLACGSGAPQADFTPQLVSGPDGTHLDPATWIASYHSDLDDAGPHDFAVSIPSEGGMPEAASLKVWIADAGPGVTGNTPPDFVLYTEEFGLPVLACWPGWTGGALPTTTYVRGFCSSDGVAYPSSYIKLTEGPSEAWPKPSYTLDFTQQELQGEQLDMHDKDHLELVSTFDDPSYVRQKLFLDLWRDLEDLSLEQDRATADTEYVVLYLDDAYAGLYLATDPVDAEFFDERALSPDGNVYRAVSEDANYRETTAAGLLKPSLRMGWEKDAGDFGDWTDLEDLTDFVATTDGATFATDAGDWIRVSEFMDWYLLVGWAGAADNVAANTLLFDDPLNLEFRYAPHATAAAFGQDALTQPVASTVLVDLAGGNRIFELFEQDPVLAARYAEASDVDGPLHPASVQAHLDAYALTLAPSIERDWAVWEAEHEAYPDWAALVGPTDPETAMTDLEAWVAARGASFSTP